MGLDTHGILGPNKTGWGPLEPWWHHTDAAHMSVSAGLNPALVGTHSGSKSWPKP